jgi:hypothetical protein
MDIFQFIYDWFTIDVYNFVMEILTYLTFKLIVLRIEMSIWAYSFFWGVAKVMMEDLGVASRFASTLNAIPPDIRANLEYFNVFTGLQWIFQAFTTKFIMKFFQK